MSTIGLPTSEGRSLMSLSIAGVKRLTWKSMSRKIIGMFVLAWKLFKSLLVVSCSSIFPWSCEFTVISSSFNDWSSSRQVSSSSFAALIPRSRTGTLRSCSLTVQLALEVARVAMSSFRAGGSLSLQSRLYRLARLPLPSMRRPSPEKLRCTGFPAPL